MTVVFPDAVKSQGKISVVAIALADLTSTSSPSLAELNTDGVNVSMYLYTGSAVPVSTTNTGESPRRLGSKNIIQEFGTTNHALGDLQYVYDPQASSSDPANAAKTLLVEGDEFYLVYRYGVDSEDAFALADKVNVWHVQVGPQNEGSTGDGEFDQLSITQAVIAKSTPVKGVAIAA